MRGLAWLHSTVIRYVLSITLTLFAFNFLFYVRAKYRRKSTAHIVLVIQFDVAFLAQSSCVQEKVHPQNL